MTIAVAALAGAPALAVDGVWKQNSNGNWSNAAFWTAGVPSQAGDTATFGSAITQDRIITVDQPFSVGALTLDDNNRYTIRSTGPGQLTTSQPAAAATITAQGADHTLSASLTLASDTLLTVGGTSTLTLTSAVTGTNSLSKSGSGTLVISGTNTAWSGALCINQGLVRLGYVTPAADSGAYKGVGTGAISVSNGATLDLDRAVRAGNFTGSLVNTIHVAGSGVGGLGALRSTSSADVVLTGAITLDGPATFRSDASATASIGFAIGDPLTGAGALSGTGPLTLLRGGTNAAQSAFQLNVRSSHTGGTILDGVRLTVTPLGSLVGSGAITVKSNAELRLSTPAGPDPLTASVSSNSVSLAGGTLVLSANHDLAAYIAADSTGGQLLLQNVQYDGGGTKLLDLSTIPGSNFRLGSLGASSIASDVILHPNAASNTLRFGGGNGTLAVNAAIADHNAAPTHVQHSNGGTLVLSAANTFSGQTTLGGGTVRVTHASALGAATGGDADDTRIFAGAELVVGPALTIANERIHLSGGRLSVDPTSIIDGPIVIDGASRIVGGEQRGPISGSASLEIGLAGSTQLLTGANNFTGDLRITAGKVEARSSSALGGASAGTSIENSSELILTAASAEPIILRSGTLRLGATSIYTGHAVRAGGNVLAEPGHLFNGIMEIQTPNFSEPANFSAPLAGSGTVRKTGNSITRFSGLTTAFDGPIEVRDGTLSLSGASLGSTNGATIVSNSGVLEITSGTSYELILLNNANGVGKGALHSYDGATLQGPIHLGDVGSTIGASFAANSAFILAVPISGGLLTVAENGALKQPVRIAGSANTYTGETIVAKSGSLSIGATGTLTETSRIAIRTNARFVVEPADPSATNRVRDSIPVVIHDGQLSVEHVSERFDNVTIEPGVAELNVHTPPSHIPATMIIGNLNRRPHALVTFSGTYSAFDFSDRLGGEGADGSFIRIENGISPSDGMIGGWAFLPDGNFAGYGPNGVKLLVPNSNDINANSTSANVQLSSSAVMTSPSSMVNSLRLLKIPSLNLHLNGTLIVDSGGISSDLKALGTPTITGGIIQPGPTADGELVLIGQIDISSSITDAPGKPTTVIANNPILRGVNTYTGGTFVTGSTVIATPTSSMPPTFSSSTRTSRHPPPPTPSAFRPSPQHTQSLSRHRSLWSHSR